MTELTKKDVKVAAAAGDLTILSVALANRQDRLRRAAIKALQSMGTSEASDVLAERAQIEWDPVLQEDAAKALTKIGDARSGEANRRSLWLRGLIDEEPDASVPVRTSSGGVYKRQELDVSRARREAVKADRRGARVMGVFMLLAGVFGAWLFWPSENYFDKVLMTVGPTTVTWAFPLAVLVLVSAGFGLAGLALFVHPALFDDSFDSTRFGRDDAGSTGGLHADRGDGYCAHCYQPWPCESRRE